MNKIQEQYKINEKLTKLSAKEIIAKYLFKQTIQAIQVRRFKA